MRALITVLDVAGLILVIQCLAVLLFRKNQGNKNIRLTILSLWGGRLGILSIFTALLLTIFS